jgi:hypothetical protein
MDRQLAGLAKVARSNDTLRGAVRALRMTSFTSMFAIHFEFQYDNKVLALGLQLAAYTLG